MNSDHLATAVPSEGLKPVAPVGRLSTTPLSIAAAQWASWVNAVNCVGRDPYADVRLDGRTVIAIHNFLANRVSTDDNASRFEWLQNRLQGSLAGGVEVNDQRLVYEDVPQGENVRLYWYPATPVGFMEVKAGTLGEAIDLAMHGAPHIPKGR